jgi:predicted Zn-dependent protease
LGFNLFVRKLGRAGLVAMVSLILIACATKPKKDVQINLPNEPWWEAAVSSSDLTTRNLAQVRQGILRVSGRSFMLGTTVDTEINAYATMENGQALIVMTTGFLGEFATDQDVLASVMGHELAHHQFGHTKPGYLENRNATVQAMSTTVGMISSFFIPFSGLITGNMVKAAGLSYSRDDEREADLLGMQWAIGAGYSPCGSYRFAQRLQALNQGAALTWFSTHPGLSERMENAQRISIKTSGSGCG